MPQHHVPFLSWCLVLVTLIIQRGVSGLNVGGLIPSGVAEMICFGCSCPSCVYP